MITNPEKTIYALYHKSIVDSQLAHYRKLDGIDPHKLTVNFLVNIALDFLVRDDKIKEFDKDIFRFALLQWLFSLVIRDQKIIDIVRYENTPKIPWEKHFEEYNEETCEYIRIEKDENDYPQIYFSVQVFNQSSVLFRQFILTLMADRFKGQVDDPMQLVYTFCSELCVLINDLYHNEEFMNNIKNSFEVAKAQKNNI